MNKKTVGIAVIVVLVIVILLGVGFALKAKYFNEETVDSNKSFDLTQDDSLSSGEVDTMSKEEIQEQLNKQVQEGMINISMNVNPIFEDSKSDGNLLIYNDENVNKHPQVIEIYRQDTGEMIYKSGIIPVGKRLDNDKLMMNLDAGDYKCTAYFNSVDETTGELLGKAGAEILITIQS